ncbi:MAG: hypothetical protein IKS72_08120 [Prevotella sp.]|nr:hypothetical protein [Prevotella sp.]
MPTREEFQELFDNTTSKLTKVNGVNGLELTSNTNGKSIFLPFTHSVSDLEDSFYWLPSRFSSGDSNTAEADRVRILSEDKHYGYSTEVRFVGKRIRPVIKKSELGIEINTTNFPDAKFRSYVSKNFDMDNNGYLSSEEVAAVKLIYIEKYYEDLVSIKGVEFFTELTQLYCRENNLASIDVSKNKKLEELHCFKNKLTKLDISQNTALTRLDCGMNSLTELNVSANTALTALDCDINQLTKLDVSQNTALTVLYCSANQLTSLDVSQNTALTTLRCDNNQLTELDVSKNTALTYLSCTSNQINGDKMQALVNSLQTVTSGRFYAINTNNTGEGNVITKSQVKIATDKSWKVYDSYGNKEYAGSDDPTTDPKTLAVTFTKATTPVSELSNEDKFVLAAVVVLAQKGKLDGYSVGIDPRDKGVVTLKKGTKTLFVSDNNKGITVPSGVTSADNINVTLTNDLRKALTTDLATQLASYDAIQIKFDIKGIKINETNFPDEKFRAFVSSNYDTDKNGYLSPAEIAAVTQMDCTNKSTTDDNGITNLKGIEHFTALVGLGCNKNNLGETGLDLSKNTKLQVLGCTGCKLKELNLSKNTALRLLSCQGNALEKLDVSKNTALTYLACYANQIKGDAMQTLVNNLPTPTSGKFIVVDKYYTSHDWDNVITKSQVAIAKGKNWTVYDNNNGTSDSDWVEYEGIDDTPTSIDASLNDNGQLTNDSWYSIDGKRLSGEPTQKGVYIVNGKKVVK